MTPYWCSLVCLVWRSKCEHIYPINFITLQAERNQVVLACIFYYILPHFKIKINWGWQDGKWVKDLALKPDDLNVILQDPHPGRRELVPPHSCRTTREHHLHVNITNKKSSLYYRNTHLLVYLLSKILLGFYSS